MSTHSASNRKVRNARTNAQRAWYITEHNARTLQRRLWLQGLAEYDTPQHEVFLVKMWVSRAENFRSFYDPRILRDIHYHL